MGKELTDKLSKALSVAEEIINTKKCEYVNITGLTSEEADMLVNYLLEQMNIPRGRYYSIHVNKEGAVDANNCELQSYSLRINELK